MGKTGGYGQDRGPEGQRTEGPGWQSGQVRGQLNAPRARSVCFSHLFTFDFAFADFLPQLFGFPRIFLAFSTPSFFSELVIFAMFVK